MQSAQAPVKFPGTDIDLGQMSQHWAAQKPESSIYPARHFNAEDVSIKMLTSSQTLNRKTPVSFEHSTCPHGQLNFGKWVTHTMTHCAVQQIGHRVEAGGCQVDTKSWHRHRSTLLISMLLKNWQGSNFPSAVSQGQQLRPVAFGAERLVRYELPFHTGLKGTIQSSPRSESVPLWQHEHT